MYLVGNESEDRVSPDLVRICQLGGVGYGATIGFLQRVRGVLVDFSGKSINEFYNLELVNDEAYNRLQENPNYPEVLRMLTNVCTSKLSIWLTFIKCGITLLCLSIFL